MEKIYDNIFKTMIAKNPNFVIPLINEVFGTDFASDEKVIQLSNEHIKESVDHDKSEIITDSYIKIRERCYHLECQSNLDETIVFRMIEYDFHIALDHAIGERKSTKLMFPRSAVLYLRHNGNTPDEVALDICFPSGESVKYSVPIIKVMDISKDEIMQKHLYFLIPYYVMRFEKEDSQKVCDEIAELAEFLKSEYNANRITGYDIQSICEHIKVLSDQVYPGMLKEGGFMGGIVLETQADRILAEGRTEGRAEENANLLDQLIKDGKLTVEEAARYRKTPSKD